MQAPAFTHLNPAICSSVSSAQRRFVHRDERTFLIPTYLIIITQASASTLPAPGAQKTACPKVHHGFRKSGCSFSSSSSICGPFLALSTMAARGRPLPSKMAKPLTPLRARSATRSCFPAS